MTKQQIAKECISKILTQIVPKDELISVIEALEEFREIYDMIFSLTNLI